MTASRPGDDEARIDRVFVALGRMTHPDLLAMRAAWDAGDSDVRQRAWAKIRAQLRSDPRAQLVEDARDRLNTWASESFITWRAGAQSSQVIVPGGIDEADLRRAVQPPALDAISAMLVDEVLDDDERDELLEPVRIVTAPDAADD